MKQQKHILLTLLFLVSFSNTQANYRSDIYQAYISKDMGKWKNIIDQMEKETSKTNAFVLEWINYQYGYIGWCLGTDRKEEAEKVFGLGREKCKLVGFQVVQTFIGECLQSSILRFPDQSCPNTRHPFLGPKVYPVVRWP